MSDHPVTNQPMSCAQLLATADQLGKAGRTDLVIALYRQWLAQSPNDPLSCAIAFNLGLALYSQNDLAGSVAAYQSAIATNPNFYQAYINLSQTLERGGLTAEAVQIYFQLINRLGGITGEAISHKLIALKQLARLLIAANLYPKASEVLHISLDIDPSQTEVLNHWLHLRQRLLKWPVLQPFGAVTKAKMLTGFAPLALATFTDDPLLQLTSAYHYGHEIGQPETHFLDHYQPKPPRTPNERIKVGYVSSDFRGHAVGYLVSELCELHDRDKVEIFVYYCGIPNDDPTKARIKASAEHWLDITPLSDEEAAKQIVADGIEVLVDFNGYTRDARTRMLAMRPAPVIANWLGYPGTMATPYHHYIIADPFIIPEISEKYYTETVKRLPCYQPSDRKRVVSSKPCTRKDAGLPEDAVVFCSFNAAQKIVPFTWRRWMAILARVPNSVLWLLSGSDDVSTRLRELAAEHGIDPTRLIFAPVMSNPDHLARIPLADLFLDSLPYGAHTTASDALWMGVPVLTVAGRGFAARVCGSLVSAAGLSDMVMTTEADYIEKAVALGHDPGALKALRARLAEARDHCVLFDMPRLVASMERILGEMADDYRAGRRPGPDLANMDVYHDIGLKLHDDGVETALIPDYDEGYRQKLAERHQLQPVGPDTRLWKG